MLRAFAAVALCAIALVGAPGAEAATLGCADDARGTTDLSSWEPAMLAATNAHRANLGLEALQLDATLQRASVWKARDLAARNYFAHDDPALGDAPARSPWDRLTACGWTSGGSRAENIAAGQTSGAAFVEAWINSPGHRANIENAALRYVGFGIASASSSRYGAYAVQMFASVPGPTGVTPSPPAATPAAPTISSLSFTSDGLAKLLCPTLADPAGTRYVDDSVTGAADVSRTAAGCLRIQPRVGEAAASATVSYRAVGPTGLASAPVVLQVTIEAAPRTLLENTDPVTTAPAPAVIRSASAVVTKRRCRGRLAVGGWCFTLTVRGQLVAADGSALARHTVVAARRTAAQRWVTQARLTTSGSGAFVTSRTLRPPSARAAGAWIRRHAGAVRLSYAGTASAAPATSLVSTRIR